MTITAPSPAPQTRAGWDRLWLEITRDCQLRCDHCYAGSGPRKGSGSMTLDDWRRVIDQAAALGVREVCIIGGEPTMYPGLATLINRALAVDVRVEVYSNLVHVSDALWQVLAQDGVRLATSWYSDDQDQHAKITGLPTWRQTCRNIARAVELAVPVRVGVVHVLEEQRVDQAREQLQLLGVKNISVDRTRRIGRAAVPSVDPFGELCGRCGQDRAAVGPDGEIWLCTMARTGSAGNVRDQALADILNGPRWRELRARVPRRTADIPGCNPDSDGNDCSPAESDTCAPSFCNPDD
ncbi:radical SAM protein [Actinomadura gamaensis]|uniref:Radical SAM protein n=1 Tax=Actinomadura gamaensis TaxID=1763541 RepID=A0ABV9U7S1_9ACTN